MIRDALVHCRKVTAERQGDNVTIQRPPLTAASIPQRR